VPDLVDSVVSNAKPESAYAGRVGAGEAEQSVTAGDEGRVSNVRLLFKLTPKGAFSIEQNVSVGEGGEATGNTNTVAINLSKSDYFFVLEPFELREGGEAGKGVYVPVSADAKLCAGRTYRLRVSLSENEFRAPTELKAPTYKLKQWPFKIAEEMSLCLRVDGKDQNVLDAVGEIIPYENQLTGAAAGATRAEFDFTIRKGYPLTFKVVLEFYRGDSLIAYTAASLELEIAGSEALPPPSPDKLLDLPADIKPPANTAILHVTPGGEGRLRLVGWAGGRADSFLSLDVNAFKWLNPAGCATAEEYSQKLNRNFYDYTLEEAESVRKWFEKALRLYGEGCGVVIVDETGSQIPWEMFKLGGGLYLGAQAIVVRWSEAQYRSNQAAKRFADPRYVGRVSAYVHPDDAKEMAGLAELSQLLAQYTTDPEMLEYDLLPQEGAGQVGLVYLCYGGLIVYGDEEASAANLRRFKPYNEDVEIRFEAVGDALEPRPIFFANAPYTGLILRSGQKTCGIARAILKQVAASYIGVLAPVERAYAARFAQKLLEEAASASGVKVGEFLRRQRAEAAARVNSKLPPQEWKRARRELAYPFLYVHYGHPNDWLKISPAPEGEAADREGDDV
jgi:hypothetical protein